MTMPDSSETVAKAMHGFDMLSMIAEATIGYRNKLVEGGVSAEAADRMAEEYHTAVLSMATANAKPTGGQFPRRGR